MTLIGVDDGTTHCKAGVVDLGGRTIKIASRPMMTMRAPEGYAYFDPETVWNTLISAIQEVAVAGPEPIQAVGIASMAESGLLIDRKTGEARTSIIPWFERAPQTQA